MTPVRPKVVVISIQTSAYTVAQALKVAAAVEAAAISSHEKATSVRALTIK